MNVLELARKEAKRIITDSVTGFAVSITLTAPNSETVTITGLHVKHHIGIDTDGNEVNTKNAHITFDESSVIEVNALYPLRDVNGEVFLYRHKVDVKDSTGIVKNYVIREWFTDETFGNIRCTLGDFE